MSGCILCANGNDLPEGERCAGCGRGGQPIHKGYGGMGGVIAGGGIFNRTLPIGHNPDAELLNRAMAILSRFGTENIGWKSLFRRWYYSDEPLRNDAANLVRESGFMFPMPFDTRLVGDPVSRPQQTTPSAPDVSALSRRIPE